MAKFRDQQRQPPAPPAAAPQPAAGEPAPPVVVAAPAPADVATAPGPVSPPPADVVALARDIYLRVVVGVAGRTTERRHLAEQAFKDAEAFYSFVAQSSE